MNDEIKVALIGLLTGSPESMELTFKSKGLNCLYMVTKMDNSGVSIDESSAGAVRVDGVSFCMSPCNRVAVGIDEFLVQNKSNMDLFRVEMMRLS